MLFLAAVFFELYYIFDAVDGQLARARNVGSKGGAFFDEWGNFLVPPFVICSIGLNFASAVAFPWAAILAAYTVLSIPLIEVVLDRWFADKRKVSEQVSSASASEKQSPVRLLYSLLYRSCTMPVVMNLVSIATVLTLFGVKFPLGNLSLLGLLVCYYATVGTGVWMSKVVKVAQSV